MGVRKTASGKWEVSLRSSLLPKPHYQTFDDEQVARTYESSLKQLLAKGIVPAELAATTDDRRRDPLLVQVIREYMHATPVTASDDALLGVMLVELAGVRVGQVTAAWAMGYVGQLKARKLAPGTIRKRIGALARALDWYLLRDQAAGDALGIVNPLRLLPRGYSTYGKTQRDAIEAAGGVVPVDVSRDRRMADDEYKRILAALAGEKRSDRERALDLPDGRALEVLFKLIVNTGMRLREAYTLRIGQVDLQTRTITVRGTNKRGGAPRLRHVPMTKEIHALMTEWCAVRVGLLFPWWDGSKAALDRTTNRLSQMFRRLFEYAKVPNFTEHDLRHEATCRWLLMRDARGAWVFSELEICKIMGWLDLRMMVRYASLRGSDLAARLA